MRCKIWKCGCQHADKWAYRLVNKHTAVFPPKLKLRLGVLCRGASAHVAYAQPKVPCMALGVTLVVHNRNLAGSVIAGAGLAALRRVLDLLRHWDKAPTAAPGAATGSKPGVITSANTYLATNTHLVLLFSHQQNCRTLGCVLLSPFSIYRWINLYKYCHKDIHSVIIVLLKHVWREALDKSL